MASLVITKDNFITMIPKLFDIVKRVEKLEISDDDHILHHDEALDVYQKGDVVRMSSSVRSADDFLQFVQTHA